MKKKCQKRHKTGHGAWDVQVSHPAWETAGFQKKNRCHPNYRQKCEGRGCKQEDVICMYCTSIFSTYSTYCTLVHCTVCTYSVRVKDLNVWRTFVEEVFRPCVQTLLQFVNMHSRWWCVLCVHSKYCSANNTPTHMHRPRYGCVCVCVWMWVWSWRKRREGWSHVEAKASVK